MSNDNPYSEALFKTLKYTPIYPLKLFDTIDVARTWVLKFVRWYNNHHRHSGIKFVTPNDRHTGADKMILENRKKIYMEARKRTPECQTACKNAPLSAPNSGSLLENRFYLKH